MIVSLTYENFSGEALEAENQVLIDFWAPWCGPCRLLTPIIDEIAGENIEGLKVCKVNVDEEPLLAAEFRIMTIPTLVLMRGGKIAAQSFGLQPKSLIMSLIQS